MGGSNSSSKTADSPTNSPVGSTVRLQQEQSREAGEVLESPAAGEDCLASTSFQLRLIQEKGNEADFNRDYELQPDDVLGKGAFATVCKATHRDTGLVRAAKNVKGYEADTGFWVSNITEVDALMQFLHPNIARLFEYYTTDEGVVLLQEFCAGGTLQQRVEAGPSTLDEVARVLRHMLRAVLCCNLQGIAHRDLKPDNFMFGSNSSDAACKLIDFGLSMKLKKDAAGEKYLPESGQVAGHWEWTAPETIKGVGYGLPSEVWSLGCIFYYMLKGEPMLGLCSAEGETRRYLQSLTMEEDAAWMLSQSFVDRKLAKLQSDGASHITAQDSPGLPRAVSCCNLEDAHELLRLMLEADPTKRISLIRALEHPFVVETERSYKNRPADCGTFDSDIGNKMAQFSAKPALVRLAAVVEAHLMGPHDLESRRPAYFTFRALDKDGDGIVTAADVAEGLKQHGLEVLHDLESVCRRVTPRQHGKMNVVEFVASVTTPQLHTESRISNAVFCAMDVDGDGYITAGDVQATLREGEHSATTAMDMMQEVEDHEESKIDLQGFEKLLNAN